MSSTKKSETNEGASSSQEPKDETSVEDQLVDPFIEFECDICHMQEKCLFGDLSIKDGYYNSPVYFIRDPFEPPSKVKSKKPSHDDFLIIGAPCSLCNRPVCFDKGCSVFFGNNFCSMCITRERRLFPDQVLELLSKGVAAASSQSK